MQALSAGDRIAVVAVANAYAPVDGSALVPLMRHMRVVQLQGGEALLRAGDAPAIECFVLQGLLRTWVGDAQGRSVTLDFHEGPCALTPSVVRTLQGRSRVHCDAVGSARLVVFDAQSLVDCMPMSTAVQCWGDAVLRAELMRRADREWALAALSAQERLLACRAAWPGLESLVPHRHLASYLGITPVSLSRLRAKLR
jgi:CRP-like cAMP-binding protein